MHINQCSSNIIKSILLILPFDIHSSLFQKCRFNDTPLFKDTQYQSIINPHAIEDIIKILFRFNSSFPDVVKWVFWVMANMQERVYQKNSTTQHMTAFSVIFAISNNQEQVKLPKVYVFSPSLPPRRCQLWQKFRDTGATYISTYILQNRKLVLWIIMTMLVMY